MRDDKPASRQLTGLHVPTALEDMMQRDNRAVFQWFVDTPIERIARLRPYQQRAIQESETALMKGQRALMVAMATGTGKTYTTAAQIYRLLESRFAKRILFLVDRKALAAQAVREFAAFNTPRGNKFDQEYEVYSQRFQREDFGDEHAYDPKLLPEAYLTHPDGSQTFLYVCTIQRMAINLFGREAAFGQHEGEAEDEEDASHLDIPIHAFDVIIAEECHRGYTPQDDAVWQATLRHFDAIRIGLTATPAQHTVAIFGEPVFRYGVQEAIRDGWLVDYAAVSVKSGVRLKGAFLKEGERVLYVDTETGQERLDHLEDERAFSTEDIERRITAPDSNRKIIEEIARYAREHQEQTGHFPKILIFAVNDLAHTSHADNLVRLCREVFGEGDAFVQKITGNKNVDRPLRRIREFRNRPEPKIVVTVDMLSTGVDIPALEFIVFLRPVKSRILWEQMLGRGTRRCDDLSPPKSHFTVFDCFDGSLIEYFKGATGFEMVPNRARPVAIAEIIENIWQNVERDYNVRRLTRRLRRIEKDMSGEARDMFARFIEDGDMGCYAEELPARLKRDFAGTMKLLRDPAFQNLLENYPRAKRSFIVAEEFQDQVSSEYKFRVGDEHTGFRFQPGDVLYGRLRPYLNKVWQADRSGVCSSEFIVFPASEKIAGEYLAYLLRDSKFLAFTSDLNRGDRPRISFSQFADFEFPVPAPDEQRRIAKQLDRIASRLDDTKARLDTLPLTLKRFRMAILTAACSGRLTADWRKTHGDETAKQLLNKIMDIRLATAARESDRRKINEFHETYPPSLGGDVGLPTSWMATHIGTIGQVCNGSTPSRKNADFWAGIIPWVSSGEVQNCRIAETREGISQKGYNNNSVRLFPTGTVLIAMIGEGKTRGQSAILDIEACINQNIAAVVIDHGFIDPGYLWYWFQGQYEANRQAGSGSGPQALNCQRVRELPFNLPPLAEQAEIVRRVEALLKQADAIEARYRQARAFVDKLMPAALANAFRGELL